MVERAVAAAKRRNPAIEESIFNFLRDILLFRFPENLDDEAREAHTRFVLKFQQCTGPIMAKGLEDTAFYIYNRLAALNEVGGEPQQFGVSVDDFHRLNAERQRDWPATLLTTSTHDTKRSEDVRARMVAISEIPQLWRTSLTRWRTINHRAKTAIDEAKAPDGNEEYLLYQTLLGTWPVDANGEPDASPTPEFIARIQAYMAKALNEAKMNTSWIQPNEQWDRAMHEFIAKILEPSPRNRFLASFLPVVQQIAQLGVINSLTQVLLKLTVPGVPDIYQGNEVLDFSLVDPDNRRPVDYLKRRKILESLPAVEPDELLRSSADGRLKLFVTHRLLRFRREHPALFSCGSYTPLRVTGAFAESCVAFLRQHENDWLLVLAPRLSARVGYPPIGELWQDTRVEIFEGLHLSGAHDVFTGADIQVDGHELALAEAFAVLPFAAWTNLRVER